MEVTEEHKNQINNMLTGMKCSKNFKCYRSGFEKVARIKMIAKGELIECLSENGRTCQFGVDFGSGVFCECPIRNYMAKKMYF